MECVTLTTVRSDRTLGFYGVHVLGVSLRATPGCHRWPPLGPKTIEGERDNERRSFMGFLAVFSGIKIARSEIIVNETLEQSVVSGPPVRRELERGCRWIVFFARSDCVSP